MIAKMLLPHVGGAPSTWTTCVLFFQAVLPRRVRLRALGGPAPPREPSSRSTPRSWLLPLAVLPFSIVSGAPGSGASRPTSGSCARWSWPSALRSSWPLAAGRRSSRSGWPEPGCRDRAIPTSLRGEQRGQPPRRSRAYPVLIEPSLRTRRGRRSYWARRLCRSTWPSALAVRRARLARIRVRSREKSRRRARGGRAVAGAPTLALDRARRRARRSLMLRRDVALTADAAGLPFLWILPLGLYLLSFVLAFARCAQAVPRVGSDTFRSPPSSSCSSG